ncbi:MOB kinase activator family protein, partial [Kipferlia bialata]
EWMFLCACHPSPRECSAIDYIVHTLDATGSHLNSTASFPNRNTIPHIRWQDIWQ